MVDRSVGSSRAATWATGWGCQAASAPLRWQYSPWYEPEKSAYTELEFAAMAWAGPAVRDHAQYVENDGHTRIRVSRTQENSLKVLVAWAYQRGLPLKLSLDASKPLDSVKPLPILAKTNIPVWLVTPQGLVAARLTSLHTGDPCLGGGWLELEAGAGLRPAIWAILFLPEEVRASAAIIERLKPEPDSDPYLLAMHSKLTVSWPDMRLPMLTVSAKKFQWRKYPQREKETPPILGTAWGTIIETAVPEQGQLARISAAGTPECLPR